MHPTRPRIAPHIAALAAVLLPTLALAQGKAYVAANDQTVTTYTEESQGERPAHVIWVRNASSIPIHVFSVSLRDCENIRTSCSVMPVKLTVKANGRAILKRIEPRDPQRGFSYRSSMSWRPDSSEATAALQTLATAGDANAAQQLAQRAEAAAARGASLGNPNHQLDQDAIVALGARIHALRVEPDSIVVPVERFFLIHDVRVLALDAHGQVLGRVRAYQWGITPVNVQVLADTVIGQKAGRTRAQFRLASPAPPVGVELPIIVTATP